jgi:membrane-associated phospholipid phosphatase
VLADEPAHREAAAYGSIALGATLLAAERLLHKRHYLTDVVVGGLIGTATSLAFYRYQEWQLRSDRDSAAISRKGPVLGWSMAW